MGPRTSYAQDDCALMMRALVTGSGMGRRGVDFLFWLRGWWLSLEHEYAPGAGAGFDFVGDGVGGQVYEGHIVGRAVGRVKGFAVERESDTRGALADFNRVENLVGGRVDGNDLLAAAGAHIEPGSIGRHDDIHGLDEAGLA